MRAALLALLADPRRARAMGRAGRARIVDGFTWTHAADVAAARIAALLGSAASADGGDVPIPNVGVTPAR